MNVRGAIATSWGYWIFVGYWLCEVALFLFFGLLAIGAWAAASGLLNTRIVYNLDENGSKRGKTPGRLSGAANGLCLNAGPSNGGGFQILSWHVTAR